MPVPKKKAHIRRYGLCHERAFRLELVELRVETTLFNEIGVRAALNNSATVKHENPVGTLHRTQAMRNEDRRAAMTDSFERHLDEPLGM